MKRVIRADLQFHPFKCNNYGLVDILKEMEEKKLDVLAALDYDWDEDVSLYPVTEITQDVRDKYFIKEYDNFFCYTSKKTGDRLFIVLGQEIEVASRMDRNWNFHFLSIGARGIKARFVEDAIEEIIEKGGIPIWDHPFVEPDQNYNDISKKREGKLLSLFMQYKGKVALEWNGYSLPFIRLCLKPFGYGNINKKVERWAKICNMPLIPTTDVHGKNKNLMKDIGICYIEIVLDEAFPSKDVIMLLKEKIISLNFDSKKGYVSFSHFVQGFGLDLLAKIIL